MLYPIPFYYGELGANSTFADIKSLSLFFSSLDLLAVVLETVL